MAQINLLKQKSSHGEIGTFIPKFLARLLVLALMLVLGYYGWIFYKAKSVEKSILKLEAQIQDTKNKLAETEGRNELVTRQGQLKELDLVINNHAYWAQFIPQLAKVTLKTATFSSLQANGDGELTLSATVPSLEDLDKFLQIFDLPEIAANFNDIRIGSYHKVPDGDKITVKFEVKMKFNKKLLQYQETQSATR